MCCVLYIVGERIPCPYEGCTYAALKQYRLKIHIANQHTQKVLKSYLVLGKYLSGST